MGWYVQTKEKSLKSVKNNKISYILKLRRLE